MPRCRPDLYFLLLPNWTLKTSQPFCSLNGNRKSDCLLTHRQKALAANKAPHTNIRLAKRVGARTGTWRGRIFTSVQQGDIQKVVQMNGISLATLPNPATLKLVAHPGDNPSSFPLPALGFLLSASPKSKTACTS